MEINEGLPPSSKGQPKQGRVPFERRTRRPKSINQQQGGDAYHIDQQLWISHWQERRSLPRTRQTQSKARNQRLYLPARCWTERLAIH